MAEKGDKFLSLDEFKEKVYKNIGTLESQDAILSGEIFEGENKGCFGFVLMPFARKISVYGHNEFRKSMKLGELETKADEILAQKEVKDILCEKLDATIVLPIDAAYKITPVLYALALENEEKVPFDTMLFAIISRTITNRGVENFCAFDSDVS